LVRVSSLGVKKPRVNQIPAVGQKHGYRGVDKDPDMDVIIGFINSSGMNPEQIEAATAKIARPVSRYCINGWLFGTVKRPQNYTLTSVAMALGIERTWSKKSF
jgi:hypothetical protein